MNLPLTQSQLDARRAPFHPPRVEPGTPVMFWPHPAMSTKDRTFGRIIATAGTTATVLAWYPGQTMFRDDCVHKDDPCVKERPESFADNARGVWELTQGEKDFRAMDARIRKIEDNLAQIAVGESLAAPKAAGAEAGKKTTTKPPKKK